MQSAMVVYICRILLFFVRLIPLIIPLFPYTMLPICLPLI